MATKVETRNSGIKKDKKEDKTYKELTSVVEKKQNRQQDGDAEAGVEAQEEQLNTMPNDPNTQPKETVEKKNQKIKTKYKKS